MKAAFALLADTGVHNLVRKLSWDIHRKYRTSLDVSRVPPHVSLKQTFEISNLSALAEYAADFASSVEPFEMNLTQLDLIDTTLDGMETGILWLDVAETESLRGLHVRLNEELTARFGNVPADFDGPTYHFHMTVAIGGQPIEIYRQIYSEFSDRLSNLQYTVQEMVMFVYDARNETNAGYMTYRILPLGKGAK